MAPESRVYRPKSDKENALIEALMETRTAEKLIERPSWTMYVDYLLNREAEEILRRHKSRIQGS